MPPPETPIFSAAAGRTARDDSTLRAAHVTAPRKGWARQLPLWLLLTGCWVIYTTSLLLSTLAYRSEPGVVFNHAMYALCTVLCSGPLWLFCRRLWRKGWSWPRAMLAAAALCYPLGYVSSLLAAEISNLRMAHPDPFRWVLLSASGAISPFCMLVVWCGLYLGLRHYERSARVETLAREAELRALRHQLTPHFLCNTLNGISTLVGEGQTQEARRMIARLGDFLRATLEGGGALEVSLAQEISYLEQYLAIEQARLGERLGVEIIVAPAALDASVPNLLLQPLVENAVQHGVVPFPAGGDVTIRAERRQTLVCLTICNRSRSPASAPDGTPTPPFAVRSPGLGLRNTAERLRVAYGAGASVRCQQEDAQAWTARIELPYHPWSSETDPLSI